MEDISQQKRIFAKVFFGILLAQLSYFGFSRWAIVNNHSFGGYVSFCLVFIFTGFFLNLVLKNVALFKAEDDITKTVIRLLQITIFATFLYQYIKITILILN
jgi:hypothetical protein